MCETVICLYPYLPDNVAVSFSLLALGGLIAWKLIKALIDSIPVLG